MGASFGLTWYVANLSTWDDPTLDGGSFMYVTMIFVGAIVVAVGLGLGILVGLAGGLIHYIVTRKTGDGTPSDPSH